MVNTHETYMQRCIQLAKNGLGTTYPNPLVGSVIVYKDKIIGEGWHRKSGESHAEKIAIASVLDCSLLKDATLYVNLEPCNHFGKTPPCADAIINCGIPRVVIGTVDPNPIVAGNGVVKLKAAGIDVIVGVLDVECHLLNKRFFTFQMKKRPYVILKWAATADGFIALEKNDERKPVWITNNYSQQIVHKWRSEEHAILVGTETVIADNPRLDVRHWTGNNPIRIVLDRNNRIPKDSHVFDNETKTIIICDKKLGAKSENLIFETIDFEKNVPLAILDLLHGLAITSVIIEGGSKTLQGFIDENLWDEARIFSGKSCFGSGVKAPRFVQNMKQCRSVGNDQLLIYRNHD